MRSWARGLLAAIALLAIAPAARARDIWRNDQDAAGHTLIGLPAPAGVGDAAVRLQDVAIGACIPKWSGVNGTSSCTTPGTDYLASLGITAGNFDRPVVAASGLVTGSISMIAANVTALEALAGSGYRDGSQVFVQTLQTNFVYRSSNASTVDHITVASVSGVGGARWIREIGFSPYWWSSVAWWVNPSTGNDEAAGTSLGAPLRTFAEWSRRFYAARLLQANGDITITVLSSAPASDPLIPYHVTSDGFVFIKVVGVPTVIASGRTLTSPRNPSLTANDHFEITDVAGGFTTWIQNYLLRTTSGTPASFWAYKDLGGNRLQISMPMNTGGTAVVTLAGGTTYEVVDLPTFADVYPEPFDPSIGVSATLLRIIGSTNNGLPVTSGFAVLDRCVVDNASGAFFSSGSTLSTVRLTNALIPATTGLVQVIGSGGFAGGLFAGDGTSSSLNPIQGFTLGGGTANTFTLGGRRLDISHDARFEKLAVMIYDWTGPLPAIAASHHSYVLLTGLGGERNTGQLVGADTMSVVSSTDAFASWNSAITTHATPYLIGGVAYAASKLGVDTNQVATRSTGIVGSTTPWSGDLSGRGINPSVIAITEGGGTQLTLGPIANTQILVRSGTTVVGSAASGFVPSTRTLTPDIGILLDGGTSAVDLSANRTIGARFDNTSITATGGGALQVGAFAGGDITKTAGSAVLTIVNDAVTNAKAANMATARFKGRITAGTGDPEDLTGTQATTLLDAFTSSLQGVAPASGGGSVNFLRADGTWSVPPGTGITQLTGDGTAGPGSGSQVFTLSNIPSGTTMAGRIDATAIAAPSTPAAGKGSIYVDSTFKNLSVKDDAGVVKHGVQTKAAVTSNFLTAISDAGVVSTAQPAYTDLTGTPANLSGLHFVTTQAEASLSAEFNLGGLTDGVLQQTVSGGVATPTAFTVGAGLVPYGASNVLTTTTTFGYNAANATLAVGVAPASADATVRLHLKGAVNGGSGLMVENTSAGAAAYAPLQLKTDSKTGWLYMTSSAYAGAEGASSLVNFTDSLSGPIVMFGQGSTRATFGSSGVTVASLAGGSTGIVSASTAGVLGRASAANIAAAQVWPAAPQFLFSTGTASAPVGDAGFIWDNGTNTINIAVDDTLALYNLGTIDADANWERLKTFASANVFNITSQKKGTGTVRPIKINADTATLTLQGSEVRASTLTAGGYVATDIGAGTGAVINVTPTAEFNYFIEIFTGSTLIALNAADQYISTSSNTDIFGSTAVEYPAGKTVPSYSRTEVCLVGPNTITSGEVGVSSTVNGSASSIATVDSSTTSCVRASGTNFGGAATDKLGAKLSQSTGLSGRNTAVMTGTLRLAIKVRWSPLSTF